MPESRAVLTVEEARQELGLGRRGMYQAIRRGEIPVLRIGRRILIPRIALERMLEGATLVGSANSVRFPELDSGEGPDAA
jgi:excisionase family DNA binding protein